MTVQSIVGRPSAAIHQFRENLVNKCQWIGRKIASVASKAFKFLVDALKFPLRYMGAKTFSIPDFIFRTPVELFYRIIGKKDWAEVRKSLLGEGYRYNLEKQLTPNELKIYLDYFSADAFAQSSQPEWIEPFKGKEISPKSLELKDLSPEVDLGVAPMY